MNTENDMDMLVEEFLDLWQENVRLWAIEREMLSPAALKEILEPALDASMPKNTPERTTNG